MVKQTKLDKNTPAIDSFKANRLCYGDNSIIWNTYCKVTCEYDGGTITKTINVWVRSSAGKYENIELHGHDMVEGDNNTVFSAGRATFAYADDLLVIHGTRDGKHYKVTIGAYDADYVKKYVD